MVLAFWTLPRLMFAENFDWTANARCNHSTAAKWHACGDEGSSAIMTAEHQERLRGRVPPPCFIPRSCAPGFLFCISSVDVGWCGKVATSHFVRHPAGTSAATTTDAWGRHTGALSPYEHSQRVRSIAGVFPAATSQRTRKAGVLRVKSCPKLLGER